MYEGGADPSKPFFFLQRARPLPPLPESVQLGIHAQWRAMWCICRPSKCPLIGINCTVMVQRDSLIVESRFPRWKRKLSLVDVGYVECRDDMVDVRGDRLKLVMFGVDHSDWVRDWIRFLVVRQRVPQSLLGRPFCCIRRPDVDVSYRHSVRDFSPLTACWRRVTRFKTAKCCSADD